MDEILVFHRREDEKRRLQQLRADKQRLNEVRGLIRELRQCCREANFRWPAQEDLHRLGELVFELDCKIRKRLRFPLWKAYKAVDGHWKLKLWQTIDDLVDRAAQNAPPRPLEKYDELLRYESLAAMAKQFFDHYLEIIRGKDPCSIAWEKFDDLFRAARPNTSRSLPLACRLREASGAPKLIAYTVFLELYFDDSRWIRRHWKGSLNLTRWIRTELQHEQTLKRLSRFLIPSFIGAEMIRDVERSLEDEASKKAEARRLRDRERKRRKK